MAKAIPASLTIGAPNKAFGQFLAEGVKPQLEKAAVATRGHIGDQLPVKITILNNQQGRAVALLTLTHPSGIARQLKSGVMTKGAAKAGLEVRRARFRI